MNEEDDYNKYDLCEEEKKGYPLKGDEGYVLKYGLCVLCEENKATEGMSNETGKMQYCKKCWNSTSKL